MTVMSKKLVENALKDACFCNLLHPEFKTCRTAQMHLFKNSLKGCFQFFLGIYVLELLIKYRKVNKTFLKKHLKNFLNSYAYGILYTNILYISLCLNGNIKVLNNYYSVVFIPAFMGSLAIIIENPIMKNLNSTMFFSMILETVVLYLSEENFIKKTLCKDTLCFMIYNSVFLFLLKNNPLSKEACILWFFNPNNNAKKIEDDNNYKKLLYSKDLMLDGLKYFTAGYSFQIVRYLVKNVGKIFRQPSTLIPGLFSKKALKTGLFFSSYVTIYNLTCRALHKLDKKEKSIHSLVAGFLSGISYCLDPTLQMNILPLSMILQILWINIRTQYKIPKWYLKEVFFAICSGILIHCVILAPTYCPIYIQNMIYVVSNGASRDIIRNVYTHINNIKANTL